MKSITLTLLLLSSLAFGNEFNRKYIDENGEIVTCSAPNEGFDYIVLTEITVEPKKGFLCAKSKSDAKKEVANLYLRYGIKIISMNINFATDINGKKSKRSKSTLI